MLFALSSKAAWASLQSSGHYVFFNVPLLFFEQRTTYYCTSVPTYLFLQCRLPCLNNNNRCKIPAPSPSPSTQRTLQPSLLRNQATAAAAAFLFASLASSSLATSSHDELKDKIAPPLASSQIQIITSAATGCCNRATTSQQPAVGPEAIVVPAVHATWQRERPHMHIDRERHS
jgi:hypothetical protein